MDAKIDEKLLPRDQHYEQLPGAVKTVNENENSVITLEERMEYTEKSDRSIMEDVELTRGKSLKVYACENLFSELQMFVKPSELRYVSRYGMADPQTGLVSLNVRFFDIDVKLDIPSKRARLKNSNIIVREHLTLKQSDLYNQVKLARKNGLIGSTWTTNGTVWAANSSEETPTVMHDIESVKQCNDCHARPDVKLAILDEQRLIAENQLVHQPRRFAV